MVLYFETTTRKLVSRIGSNAPTADNLVLTRGDKPTLTVYFLEDGTVFDPGADTVFFCLKPSGATTVLALATSFTKSGSTTSTAWSGTVNLDTTELNALLGVDTTSEVSSLVVRGEVGYIIDGKDTTSRLLSVTIENDLYRDGGSTPTSTAIEYPTAPTAGAALCGNTDGTGWIFTPVSTTAAAGVIPKTGTDGKIPSGFLPSSSTGVYPTLRVGTDAPATYATGIEGDFYLYTTDNTLWVMGTSAYTQVATLGSSSSSSSSGSTFTIFTTALTTGWVSTAAEYTVGTYALVSGSTGIYQYQSYAGSESTVYGWVAIVPASPILGASGDFPSASSDGGVAGTMIFYNGYLYFCIASGDWRRVALSTW